MHVTLSQVNIAKAVIVGPLLPLRPSQTGAGLRALSMLHSSLHRDTIQDENNREKGDQGLAEECCYRKCLYT